METGILSSVILNRMSEQVYVRDQDKNLLFINRAAAKLTGWPEKEAIGKKCYEVFGDPEKNCRDNCPVDISIREQRPMQHQSGKLLTRAGAVKEMRVSITPAPEASSSHGAAVVMMQEITHEKELQNLLIVQRDLGIHLSRTETLEEALTLCNEAVLQLEEVDCSGIYMIDQQDGSIHLAAHANLPDWFVKESYFYASDTPQAQKAKTKGPYFTDYESLLGALKLDDKEIERRKDACLKAFSMIGIRHNHTPIATLNTASYHVEKYSEFTEHALEAIASQIAGTLLKIISTEALIDSRKNLELLFDNLEDLLFVVDFNGNIVAYNRRVTEKLGYAPSRREPMHILDLAPAGMREKAEKKLAEMFAGKAKRTDIAMQARDGEIVPVETVVATGTWNNQKVLFGLCRDISDRIAVREARRRSEERAKADLKEKEVLLKEIHHRVKNNMQVISSLLYLQAIKSPDEKTRKALEEAENRVHSMALVHEILYQSNNIASINFQTYLEQLAEHVKNSFPDTIFVDVKIETGTLQLKIEQSITCGLILTELLTNSFKYAFHDATSGKITIEATPLKEPHYQLLYCDSGCGISPEDAASTKSMLGLRLVRELVQDQLEGTIILEEGKGTCWKIVWPVQMQ